MSTIVFETVPVGADSDTTMINSISGFGVIDLSPGETETITFDMTTLTGDGPTFILGTPAPAAGNLVVDDADIGTYTYTITQAQWVAAGTPGTVELSFDTNVGSFGDNYQLTITCFAPGTAIATSNGECTVESLQIGDLIRTADGRDVAVKWIGIQTISTIFSESVERLQPVRISAGALGDGLPHNDLTVTADHGMIL
ncbi:MAG: Hint domain-containing protein, partial [Pseudomonadota bacterium]